MMRQPKRAFLRVGCAQLTSSVQRRIIYSGIAIFVEIIAKMLGTILFISGQEVIVAVMLALLLFGSKEIPKLARTFAKGMKEFRRATDDIKREFENATPEVVEDFKAIKNNLTKEVNEIKTNLTKETEVITKNLTKDADVIKKNLTKETEVIKKNLTKDADKIVKGVKKNMDLD